MKMLNVPKRPKKGNLTKVAKNKALKKREKDPLVGKKMEAVLELASETLPSPDKKKVAKSLKSKKAVQNAAGTVGAGPKPIKEKKLVSSTSNVTGSPKKPTKALKRESTEEPTVSPPQKKKQSKKQKGNNDANPGETNAPISLQKPLKASQKDLPTSKALKKKPVKNLQKGLIPSGADDEPLKKKSSKKLQKQIPSVTPKQKQSKTVKVAQDLKRDILEGVCSSTLKLVNDQQEEQSGKELFDSDPKEIYLQIQLFKIPHTPYKNFRCLVPHSIYPLEPEVCLIVPDLFRGRRTDAGFAQYKETYEGRLQRTGVTGIKMLMPFTQLRYEYRQYEMKRRLIKSFDVFFCDGRIFSHCSKFFGKLLDKPLIPVHAVERNKNKIVEFAPYLQDEVNKGLRKVPFSVTPHGGSISVRHVGHSGLTREELADNIESVWKSLDEHLPGGIPNIQTVFVKGALTLPVPLYAAFEPPKEVPIGKFRDIGEAVEDELSTMPGRRVTVHPFGDIDIVDDPDDEDEEFINEVGLHPPREQASETVEDNQDAILAAGSGDEAEQLSTKESAPSAKVDPAQNERSNKKQKAEKDGDEESSDDDDVAAEAEDAYLHNWSESVSMKELEDEENKKKDAPKKRRKRAAGKPTSKPATKQATGISKNFSKGKKPSGKNVKKAGKRA